MKTGLNPPLAGALPSQTTNDDKSAPSIAVASLPVISIDFKVLESQSKFIREETLQQKVKAFIATVEKKIERIQEALLITNFQNVVYTAVEELEKVIREMRTVKINDNTDGAAVDTIITAIENPYKLLRAQIGNQLLVKDDISAAELNWKIFALPCQQQLLVSDATRKKDFDGCLQQLKGLIQQRKGTAATNLFISYAWPTPQYHSKEYWLQPFLKQLREHLRQAGIHAILDIVDNKPGGDIIQFMEQAKDANFVLVIFTESLKDKHLKGHGLKAVNTELNNISHKRKIDYELGLMRVLPFLVTGTHATSYPANYELYSTVRDWRGANYLEIIKTIITQLHAIELQDEQFNGIWNAFIQKYSTFTLSVPKAQVEKFRTQQDYKKELDELTAEEGYKTLLREVGQYSHLPANLPQVFPKAKHNVQAEQPPPASVGTKETDSEKDEKSKVVAVPQSTTFAPGNSDYKSVIMQGGLLVDKTLFIKEVIDDKTQVKLIIRPRRFGKTLNMSMLRYFFEKTDKTNEHAGLFFDRAIWKAGKQYQDEQGRYPVLFITMKDVNAKKYEEAEESIRELLSTLYKQYKELLFNGVFKNDVDEQKDYQAIIDRQRSNITQTKNALKKLTGYLQKASGKQVIVLIDEYDTPFNASYEYDYYLLMADFMRGILSPLLKDNLHLYRAVLTGILRITKEMDLSNVHVYSVLSDTYASQFGFQFGEVKELLKKTKIPENLLEDIENWYGGYQIGSQKIFNPCSIVGFINDNQRSMLQGILYRPHWLDSSENKLIENLLVKPDDLTKKTFKDLMENKPIIREISEHTVFADITKNPQTLWGFLSLCGYLTVKPVSKKLGEEKTLGEFVVANRELYGFYKTLAESWFKDEKINFVFIASPKENSVVIELKKHLLKAQSYKESLFIAAKLIDLHAVDNALVHVLLQSFDVNINKEDQAQAQCLLTQHDVIKCIMSIDKEAGETLEKSTQHGDQPNVFKYAVTPRLRKLAINKSDNTNELTQYLQQLIADNRDIKIQGMADDMRYKIPLDKIYIDLELDPVTRSDMNNLLRRFEKTQLVNILAQSVDDAHAVQHKPLLSNKTPELQRDQKQSVPLLIVPKDEKTVTDSVLPVALRKQFLRIVKSVGYKYGQSPTENFWAEIWNAGKLTREDQNTLQNVLYRLEDKTAEFANSIARKRSVEPKELFLSVAQAYQKNRHMIILGDPGAGKTTVAQWLTLKMASALESSKTEDSGQHSRKLTMGKLRLPIFVRLSEYVEYRATCKIKPSLADFLIVRAERKAEATIIKDCLNNGTVLLILDGFDEVPNALEREEIGRDIDQFIDTSVFKDQEGLFEQPHDIDSGNRLIITSRIVGNYVAKLNSEWPRLTIKAMSLASIKQYFAHWMQAIYGAGQVAQKNADALFALVREDDRLLDLAKTPQLANLIAMVYQKTNSLPRTRTELYKLAIINIMDNWRKQIFTRPISRDEKIIHAMTNDVIFRLFEPIAAEMQSLNSTISEEEMKALSARLEEYIKAWVGKPQEIVRIFLDSIWHEVGLLTEFGIGEYRFLHRSFQEYLAGRYLVRDDKNAASCLEDPRQNFQRGWNCFDLAIGLDIGLNINEKDADKRAKAARDKLVAFALDEKNIPKFRRLLAPEIRHAAGLTAVYLNLQKEKETADKDRNTRLAELFGVAEVLTKARSNEVSTQAVVMQQITKLLAEDDRSKQDVNEINLDRHTLPISLQTKALRKLVNKYQFGHDMMQKAIRELCAQYPQMQAAVEACKQALSQAQNNRAINIVSAEELYQFLQTPERQKQYPVAWGVYHKQYQDNFVPHEQALQTYCEDEKTYRTYVNDYYGKQGWVAFQRSFKAEGTSTSMVDIAARLLNAQIVVRQKNPTIQNAWEEIYCTATPVQNNKKVYVQFNGRDHFTALQENSAYATARFFAPAKPPSVSLTAAATPQQATAAVLPQQNG